MAPQADYGTNDVKEDAAHPPISTPPNGMMKTRSSFAEDLKTFAEGTVPQSIIVAGVIGTFLEILICLLPDLFKIYFAHPNHFESS